MDINLLHQNEFFKRRVDDIIDRFKTQLVRKSFNQKYAIDCFDTHALVAIIATIRVLITYTTIEKLVILQIDVKTAFLSGE